MYCLHPYCLPDSALSRIEHTAFLNFLLALRMPALVRYIAYPDAEVILPFFQIPRNINGKGKISSFMTAGAPSIYIHGTHLIDCAKMQQNPFSRLRRIFKRPVISEYFSGGVLPHRQNTLHENGTRIFPSKEAGGRFPDSRQIR